MSTNASSIKKWLFFYSEVPRKIRSVTMLMVCWENNYLPGWWCWAITKGTQAMDKTHSACGELLQELHGRIRGKEAKEKKWNSYTGRSAQHHKAGVIYSSAPQLAVSSEERLWPGLGERQSAGVRCRSQAEGRKVFINVLLAQGPTVPQSSSTVLCHAVSYFWNEKWANSCLQLCRGALNKSSAHDIT